VQQYNLLPSERLEFSINIGDQAGAAPDVTTESQTLSLNPEDR
jgi:hypothetical protein